MREHSLSNKNCFRYYLAEYYTSIDGTLQRKAKVKIKI